jgi:sugar phosphate isomerase/epimerase
LWEPGRIDFDTVFGGLREIGYTGFHANTPIDLATKSFAFLKPYADGKVNSQGRKPIPSHSR